MGDQSKTKVNPMPKSLQAFTPKTTLRQAISLVSSPSLAEGVLMKIFWEQV